MRNFKVLLFDAGKGVQVKARFVLAIAAVALLLLAVGVTPASADTITVNLNNTGVAGGPFVVATVNLTSTGTATVTFQASSGVGMVDGSTLALNVNTTQGYTGAFTNLTSNGEALANSCDLCSTGNQVDGFGTFNMIFDQKDSSNPATTVSVTLTGGGWTSASQVLALNSGGNDAASHAIVNSCTFFVGGPGPTKSPASCATTVPEPSSLVLLAFSGLLGLCSFVRQKLFV